MKRMLINLLSALLMYFATLYAVSWLASIALWMFFIGDTHENIWRMLPFVFLCIGALTAMLFFILDMKNVTSRRNRVLRTIFSLTVCIIAISVSVWAQLQLFRGWNSDEAALTVATSLYPEYKDMLVLKLESKAEIPSWTRGPSLTYIAMADGIPICRMSVTRRFWSYWTSGMYETLKKRETQHVPPDGRGEAPRH